MVAGNAPSLLNRVARMPPAYFVFVLLVTALWMTRPQLMNPNILGTFIRQAAPLGIVVLAQLLVMNARSIDLSVGGVILLVNYMISSGEMDDMSLALIAACALAVGLVVGLFNGLLVGKRRVSAVVVTLAVSVVLSGVGGRFSMGHRDHEPAEDGRHMRSGDRTTDSQCPGWQDHRTTALCDELLTRGRFEGANVQGPIFVSTPISLGRLVRPCTQESHTAGKRIRRCSEP